LSGIGQFTDTVLGVLQHAINVLGELQHFADAIVLMFQQTVVTIE